MNIDWANVQELSPAQLREVLRIATCPIRQTSLPAEDPRVAYCNNPQKLEEVRNRIRIINNAH